MPRGRHRQSPPLHQLLVPVGVSAAALVCVGGSWLVGESGSADGATLALRGFTAAAAAAAIAGAVVLRNWDRAAGRRVTELKAQQTGAEWRAEERQAELEEELDEVREERDKARGRIHDQQASLARLRNEHAALLRRYAYAEAERARVLEGRRQLELESGEPAMAALAASAMDHRQASGAPTPLTYLQASEALSHLSRNHARQAERRDERRRQREEQERKEEQRLAEQRGRERARAEAEARRRAANPAPQPGLVPGGFDFFGTGGRKRPGRQRSPQQERRDDAREPAGQDGPDGSQGPHESEGSHGPHGSHGSEASAPAQEQPAGAQPSAAAHQPLPEARTEPPESPSGRGPAGRPGDEGSGPGAAALRNVG